MPRLPDASDLPQRTPRSTRGVSIDRSGEIIGSTLVAVEQQKRAADDRFAYTQARQSLLAADLEARKQLENDNDWPTYEQRYRSAVESRIGEVAKTIRSPRDRSLFEQEARLDLEQGTIGIRQQARRKEVDWGRSTLDASLADSRQLALTSKDPIYRQSVVENAKAALQAAQEKGYVSAEEATGQWQRWVTDYADGFVDTLSAEDQVRHLSQIPDDSPVKFLPEDRRATRLKAAQREVDALRREREAEQRARLTEARQAMNDRLRDMQVAASLGLPVDVPPKATFLALYGDQEGAQRYQTAEKLAALSGDVAELQQLSTDELIQKVSSYVPTQVEGAAEQVQLQSALASNVSRIIEAREKDPAGYLAQQSPVVRKAWEVMGNDPSQAPQYLAAVRAEKERLGIRNPAVLPEGYVTAVADEIASAPAERMADRIEEESQRWGRAWPQVYGQLAGKLPDTAAVIGSGIPKSAATTLAAMAGLKSSDLEAILPSGVKMTDVRDSVSGVFEEFVRSMPAEAARTVTATLDAANRLAVKYMGDGMSRGKAAQRAYQDLVGSQYELSYLRGAAMRIPVGVDARAVESAAQQLLASFKVDSSMVDVPPGAALSDEEYAGRLSEAIRSRGYWLTSPGSTGLRLYLDGQPVARHGAPVEVEWADLVTAGQVERARRQGEQQRRDLFPSGGYLEPMVSP